MSFAQR